MRLSTIALLLVTMPGAAGSAMRLGVNTHFGQGWPIAALAQVEGAHAGGIRDTVGWGAIEQAAGRYAFTPANSGHVEQACAAHIPVLLTLTPRSRIYDDGETVFSPEGRQAFGAFAAAVARRFPCVAALEIGNEINGHSLKGRMVAQMPGSYVAILKAVRTALDAAHLETKLLSGSSLSVATGFFGRLFAAGMLPLVDGVAIHPYLTVPEQLPQQIARLRATMAQASGVKPVWASEFGFQYATPDAAPPHALKMITLLSAAGVARADWYALRDERFYPNMGLFAGGTPKPALDSFRIATTRLLAAGDARRIDMGDPLVFVYRFGDGPYVMWGSDRPVIWDGVVKVWDARGHAVAVPERLTGDPVIVDMSAPFRLGGRTVMADTLIDADGGAWSWFVNGPDGRRHPLAWQDWNWTPYVGSRAFPNFRVMGAVVSTARPAAGLGPMLIERYTAPAAGTYRLSACFEGKAEKPTKVRILADGGEIYAAVVAGTARRETIPVTLNAGGTIDIAYSAQGGAGPRPLRRRVRLLSASNNAEALCAPRGVAAEQPED